MTGSAMAAGLYAGGYRINTTPSIPEGIYRTTDEAISRGAYVIFCPPRDPHFALANQRHYLSAGLCPSGYEKLMKKIEAVEGDRLEATAEGIVVNGRLLPQSQTLRADANGRALPTTPFRTLILAPGELLMMGENCRISFDSRYFGLIDRAQVITTIRPVLLW